MDKGLGCLKSPYDSRDYQFGVLCASADKEEYPDEWLPATALPHFDQGSSSMCCACATSMSRYIYELNDSGNTQLFSPAYIYGNRAESTVEDGVYEGEGMYLKDALKQLTEAGDCYYDTIKGFGTYAQCKKLYGFYKEKADHEAYPYRVSSYYAVKTDRQIMKAIVTTGSVLASYLVTSGWYEPSKEGVITPYGNIEGGHAVLITGWKLIDEKRYWIIHNSWGDSWGDKGNGYIESNEMMIEAYCILDSVKEMNFKENG